MSRCCSLQSGLAAPEHRKWRRTHGLQLPLHPQQVAGWFALVIFAVVSFLILIPAFSYTFQPLLCAVLATLFILHVIAHLTALLLDPADPELRRLRPASDAVPEFDRSKHAHVIENGRCHLCNIETSGPRTKHCSVCNKCVGKFDHHCKWLNHCIGGRNYAAFLVCVVSAVGACIVIVGISVTELVFYHVDPSWLEYQWSSKDDDLNNTDRQLFFVLPPEVFLIIVGFIGVLAAVTAGLLLHLCLFHVYISVLGITTYEYIRNYRQLSNSVNNTNNTNNRNNIIIHKDNTGNTISRRIIINHNLQQQHHHNNDNDDKRLKICCCFKKSSSRSTNKHDNSSLQDVEIGGNNSNYDKKFGSSLDSIDRKDLQQHRCFTISSSSTSSASDGDLRRSSSFQNGFNNYPHKVNSVTVISDRNFSNHKNIGSSRKICDGCRYCSNNNHNRKTIKVNCSKRNNSSRARRGFFSSLCNSNNNNNNGDDDSCDNTNGRERCSPVSIPRRNQVQPTNSRSPPKRSTSLPALPPPTRRQMQTVSLKELGDVLAYVQQQPSSNLYNNHHHQNQPTSFIRRTPPRRYIRRKSIPTLRPTMSPTLSPIHESGLSNPSTPQLTNTRPKPVRQGVWLANSSTNNEPVINRISTT